MKRKFNYGDLIKVIDGFYENCSGIILEHPRDDYYKVEVHKICADGKTRVAVVAIWHSSLQSINKEDV